MGNLANLAFPGGLVLFLVPVLLKTCFLAKRHHLPQTQLNDVSGGDLGMLFLAAGTGIPWRMATVAGNYS